MPVTTPAVSRGLQRQILPSEIEDSGQIQTQRQQRHGSKFGAVSVSADDFLRVVECIQRQIPQKIEIIV